jgi:Zn-dependent protease
LLAVQAACWLVIVVTVSVAALAPVPEMLTGVVDPKLRVGEFVAPDNAILAVINTLPVNPFTGVTVMREVLDEVAPAATVIAVPLMLKLAGDAAVTVTVLDSLAAL